MASNLLAMASNLAEMATNLIAMASNLAEMATNLLAMKITHGVEDVELKLTTSFLLLLVRHLLLLVWHLLLLASCCTDPNGPDLRRENLRIAGRGPQCSVTVSEPPGGHLGPRNTWS